MENVGNRKRALYLEPHRGKHTGARSADETGSCGWLRSRGAACGRNSRGGAGAAVCLLQGRDDVRSKSRAPQSGAALQFSQGRVAARWENWLSARGKPAGLGEEKLPAPFAGTGSYDFIELFCGPENQVLKWFASYRSAAPNAGSEPKRKGSVKLPETRKVYGTQ